MYICILKPALLFTKAKLNELFLVICGHMSDEILKYWIQILISFYVPAMAMAIRGFIRG